MLACCTYAPATSLNMLNQIDFLLVGTTDRGACLLASNSKQWHVIHTGVIHASDQMGCSGTRGGDADAQFPGEFGIGRRHEGCHLLMPGLNELDLIGAEALEAAEQGVNTVARVAEYTADAPLIQALPEEISNGLGHRPLLHTLTGPQPAGREGVRKYREVHVTGPRHRTGNSATLPARHPSSAYHLKFGVVAINGVVQPPYSLAGPSAQALVLGQPALPARELPPASLHEAGLPRVQLGPEVWPWRWL